MDQQQKEGDPRCCHNAEPPRDQPGRGSRVQREAAWIPALLSVWVDPLCSARSSSAVFWMVQVLLRAALMLAGRQTGGVEAVVHPRSLRPVNGSQIWRKERERGRERQRRGRERDMLCSSLSPPRQPGKTLERGQQKQVGCYERANVWICGFEMGAHSNAVLE